MNILCPVDFSDTSDHAIAAAAKIAQKSGAQLDLHMIHSVKNMNSSELLYGSSMRIASENTQLEELSRELSKVYKISCYGNVCSSNHSMPTVIAQSSDQYDLVVMGTNGADSLYDSLFGTNSYHVAKESFTPVLLLPPAYDYKGFSTIVLAMDYFHELTFPPEHLIKWADLFEGRITILQIMIKGFSHQDDEKLIEAQRNIKGFLEDRHHNFKTLYSDHPVEGIIDFLNANECDVLALGFRRHPFIQNLLHKNVVKNLCALVPCPLFIFHL